MVCITGGILVLVLFLLFGLVSVGDIVPQWAKKGKLNKESLLEVYETYFRVVDYYTKSRKFVCHIVEIIL